MILFSGGLSDLFSVWSDAERSKEIDSRKNTVSSFFLILFQPRKFSWRTAPGSSFVDTKLILAGWPCVSNNLITAQ